MFHLYIGTHILLYICVSCMMNHYLQIRLNREKTSATNKKKHILYPIHDIIFITAIFSGKYLEY